MPDLLLVHVVDVHLYVACLPACQCPPTRPPACTPACPPTCPPAHSTDHPPTHPPAYPPAHPPTHPPANPPTCLATRPPTPHPPAHPSTHPPARPSGTEAGHVLVMPSVSAGYPNPSVSAVPTIISSFVVVGTFHGFEHKIKLLPEAMLVAVKTRPIPSLQTMWLLQ